MNLLKEWVPRAEKKIDVLMIQSVEEEDVEEYLLSLMSTELDLSETQQSQVKKLIDPKVFQGCPGCTDLIEHEINLKSNAKVRQMSYRIPERLLWSLKKEMDFLTLIQLLGLMIWFSGWVKQHI